MSDSKAKKRSKKKRSSSGPRSSTAGRREIFRVAWQKVLPSIRAIENEFRKLERVMESPRLRALGKAGECTGPLGTGELARRAYFIPDEVLYYGFAHLPTKSDPRGELYKELAPVQRLGARGTYLFRPSEDTPLSTRLTAEDRRFIDQAREAYAVGNREDLPSPRDVVDVLTLNPLLRNLGLLIDPEKGIRPQLAQFTEWVEQVRRAMYRKAGKKSHRVREPGRDTLIFFLAESLSLRRREIGRRAFPGDRATEEALERRVLTSLSRTRKRLLAAGYTLPRRGRM